MNYSETVAESPFAISERMLAERYMGATRHAGSFGREVRELGAAVASGLNSKNGRMWLFLAALAAALGTYLNFK